MLSKGGGNGRSDRPLISVVVQDAMAYALTKERVETTLFIWGLWLADAGRWCFSWFILTLYMLEEVVFILSKYFRIVKLKKHKLGIDCEYQASCFSCRLLQTVALKAAFPSQLLCCYFGSTRALHEKKTLV